MIEVDGVKIDYDSIEQYVAQKTAVDITYYYEGTQKERFLTNFFFNLIKDEIIGFGDTEWDNDEVMDCMRNALTLAEQLKSDNELDIFE